MTKVAKKIEFPDDVLCDVARTAQAIASDLMECDPSVNNAGLLEATLDADRVLMFGNDETKEASNDFLGKMFKEFGFSKVVKALLKTGRFDYI